MLRFSLSALCAIQTSLLLQLFLLTFLLKKSEQCDAENFQWTCHLFIFIFVFSIFFSQARCNSNLHYLFKFSYFSSDIMSHTDHWSFIFPTCLGWWILIQWISHYKLEVCNQDYKLDCKLVILQWEKQNSFSFKHHLIIFPAKEIFKHQKVKFLFSIQMQIQINPNIWDYQSLVKIQLLTPAGFPLLPDADMKRWG